jgi:uncharacterized protein YoxC
MAKENKEDKVLQEIKRHNKVLMEHMESQVKIVAEQHGDVIRRLDKLDNDVGGLKEDMMFVKTDVTYMKIAIKDLDLKVDNLEEKVVTKIDNLEKKVDVVLTDHEQRIQRLGAAH